MTYKKCENPTCENIVTEYISGKRKLKKCCSINCRNILRVIKIKQTCINRYGVDNATKLPTTVEKMKKTMVELYGEDNPSKVQSFQNKKIQTCISKRNTTHHMYDPVIVDKIKKTNINKYGHVCTLHSDEISENVKNTNIRKYGVKTPFLSSEIINKINLTNLSRYGTTTPVSAHITPDVRLLLNSPHWLLEQNKEKTIIEIAHNLNVSPRTVHVHFEKYNILVKHHAKSYFEKCIYEYVCTLISLVIQNDRVQIKPYELDIYIPELKLAFECNGEPWHKDPAKEINKLNMCKDKGIELHFIWYNEWKKEKDTTFTLIDTIIKNKITTI